MTDQRVNANRPRERERMGLLNVPFWDYGNETPTRQAIMSIMHFDRVPDAGLIAERLADLVARTPRLRERVVETPLKLTRPFWVADDDFALDRHWRHVRLPGEPRAALDAELTRLYVAPFDVTGALWDVHLLETDDGAARLAVRLHHSIGDGGSIRAIMEQLCDPRDHAVVEDGNAADARRKIEAAAAAAKEQHAGRGVGAVLDAVKSFRSNLDGGRAPVWEGPLTSQRHLDWARLSMPVMKAVAKANGVRFNDVYQTVVTAAATAALAQPLTQPLVVSMPLAIEDTPYVTDDGAVDLGSRQVSLNLPVPVQIGDLRERLRAVAEVTEAMKAARGDVSLMTRVAEFAPRQAVMFVTKRKITGANMIASNFAGWPDPPSIGGVVVGPVTYHTALAPGCPLAFVAASSGAFLDVGLTVDPGRVDGFGDIPKALVAVLDELAAASGVSV